jgi:hypothetical protein
MLAAFIVAGCLTAAAPVHAGGLLEKAKVELKAFGSHAGYIAATIGPCGGNESEVAYFTRQVRLMLDGIGGGEADFAIVKQAMTEGRAAAEPEGKDCTDEGGLALATKLGILRDAVRDAGK